MAYFILLVTLRKTTSSQFHGSGEPEYILVYYIYLYTSICTIFYRTIYMFYIIVLIHAHACILE